MTKTTFEGVLVPKYEDGGQAIVCDVNDPSATGMFVRIQSWDDTKTHSAIAPFLGRNVKITVEVVND